MKSDIKYDYKTLEKGMSTSYEKERIAVQSKARKKIFEVSAEIDRMKKMLSAIEGLSKQVSSLKSELNDVKQESFRNRVTYRCSACVHNDLDKCDRCFNCEETGHQGRYCKKWWWAAGKLEEIVGVGQPAIKDVHMPKTCLNCNVNIDNHNFICSQCKSVYYCSKKYQMNSST